jgi:hypothetical protein
MVKEGFHFPLVTRAHFCKGGGDNVGEKHP